MSGGCSKAGAWGEDSECFGFGVPRMLPQQSHIPLTCMLCSPPALVLLAVGLCFFGFLGAYLGGAGVCRGGMRVLLGGWMALGIVYGM